MDIEELRKHATTFFMMVRNLNQFSGQELRGILTTQLNPSWKERFQLNCYFRAEANVNSLLKLQQVGDCQAVSMIARSLIELAIEAAIIDRVIDAEIKVLVFSDVEKLENARNSIKRKNGQYSESLKFIEDNEARIKDLKSSVWPNAKKIRHWSNKDLLQRSDLAGPVFTDLYLDDYKVRSWHSHAGYIGFQSGDENYYLALIADSYKCAATAYELLLLELINGFQVYRADTKIRDKLEVAKMVAFTSSQEEADAIWRAMIA